MHGLLTLEEEPKLDPLEPGTLPLKPLEPDVLPLEPVEPDELELEPLPPRSPKPDPSEDLFAAFEVSVDGYATLRAGVQLPVIGDNVYVASHPTRVFVMVPRLAMAARACSWASTRRRSPRPRAHRTRATCGRRSRAPASSRRGDPEPPLAVGAVR